MNGLLRAFRSFHPDPQLEVGLPDRLRVVGWLFDEAGRLLQLREASREGRVNCQWRIRRPIRATNRAGDAGEQKQQRTEAGFCVRSGHVAVRLYGARGGELQPEREKAGGDRGTYKRLIKRSSSPGRGSAGLGIVSEERPCPEERPA